MLLAYLFGSKPPVDEALFEREAMVWFDALYRTARRLTGNDKDAEDLVQDTMVRAYRFFHQFQPGTNCRAWLMKILHNLHINNVGRRARAPATTSIDASEEFYLYAHLSDEADAMTPSPEEQVLSQVWDDEILSALDRLPLEYREVVTMCDIEEMAYKDIAAALDIPIGTVRSRLARGRRQLARMLSSRAHGGQTTDRTLPAP